MKKILALMLVGTMMISSAISVFATDGAGSGSSGVPETPSAEASYWRSAAEENMKKAEEAKKEAEEAKKAAEEAASTASSLANDLKDAKKTIEDVNKTNKEMQKQINNYAKLASQQSSEIGNLRKTANDYSDKLNAVNKDLKNAAGRGGSSSNDVRNQMLIRNNAVSYGGNIVAQGGHVEINGGKSNVTFIVGVPDGGTMTSAASLAANLKGSLVNCVTVTSTVAFKNARVNFYVSGVTAGDNIAVYQVQNGKWVQLPTAEIRQDHVVVNMTRYGTIAFIRVPVLASITN